MPNRLSVVVVHAAHIEARVPLMQRLRDDLGVKIPEMPIHALPCHSFANARGEQPRHIPGAPEVVAYHEETTRGPWEIWHLLALRAHLDARDAGATHALTLQDDVLPSSTFWPTLLALLEGRPNDVICLDCPHPAARRVFLDGEPGYTTPDGLVGIGYAMPLSTLGEYARWRLVDTLAPTRPELYRMWGEDIELAGFCMAKGLRIFHPVPCMLDHDLAISSTNDGYDDHHYRKPQVTMNELERLSEEDAGARRASMLDPKWWAREVPHVGRFFDNANFLTLLLKDKDRARAVIEQIDDDKTPEKYRRFWMRLAATA